MKFKVGDRVRPKHDLGCGAQGVGIVTQVYGGTTFDVYFETKGRSIRCLLEELEIEDMGMDENGNPIDYSGFFQSNPSMEQIKEAARHTSDAAYFKPYEQQQSDAEYLIRLKTMKAFYMTVMGVYIAVYAVLFALAGLAAFYIGKHLVEALL